MASSKVRKPWSDPGLSLSLSESCSPSSRHPLTKCPLAFVKAPEARTWYELKTDTSITSQFIDPTLMWQGQYLGTGHLIVSSPPWTKIVEQSQGVHSLRQLKRTVSSFLPESSVWTLEGVGTLLAKTKKPKRWPKCVRGLTPSPWILGLRSWLLQFQAVCFPMTVLSPRTQLEPSTRSWGQTSYFLV